MFYQRTGHLQSARREDKKHLSCWTHSEPKTLSQEQHVIAFHWNQLHCSLRNFLYLEEHGAVLFCIRRLNMVWRTWVSAAHGGHDDTLPRLPLHTPCQAAAARTKLLGLLKARIFQDALRERSSQAALTWNMTAKMLGTLYNKATLINISECNNKGN